MPSNPARDLVFISYSHENPTWQRRLLLLLKPFVRQGQLQVWADPYIQAGAVWRREIDTALARTRVGVVLQTSELLASDFVADVELPALLRGAKAGLLTLLIVPIDRSATGSTRFPDGDLKEFQWPWSPDQPLGALPRDHRNKALVTVTDAIVSAAGGYVQSGGASLSERTAKGPAALGARLGALHWVPQLPPNYLPRNEAHQALKQALLGMPAVVGMSAHDARVGVDGQGGLGKTVVAQGITCDEDVRRAFPDGVYWISLGQQPRVESLQATLAEALGERVPVDDVNAGTRLLRERLCDKACLLVLDDVWQLAHAKAFDVLDSASRLLVTTRDRSILTALGARDIRLDALPVGLARELLARWAGIAVTDLPTESGPIVEKVDYLPLAIALAGAQIHDGGSWVDVLAALRRGDLVYLDHPYGSVFKALQASIDTLEPADAARYLELAVFPEDVDVPVSVIERLWYVTSGEDPLRLRALLTRLASRNLLRMREVTQNEDSPRSDCADTPRYSERVVSLHDLQHDFLRLLVENLAALHNHLVDALQGEFTDAQHTGPQGGDRWASLPAMPTYPWQFLAYHLRHAGRDAELEGILTSPDWLFARLARFSVPALLADYGQAKPDTVLRCVRDALVLSAHVLSRDPTGLRGQLAGRLLNSPDPRIRSLVTRTPTPLQHHPELRPLTACLTSPGGALLATFEGHIGAVFAVTALPDGQRALSGSADRTMKLWDLNADTVLITFEGHTDDVRAVTVLPDGQRALSASDDHTLKLWDLAAGTVLRTFEGHADAVRAVTVLPDGQRALSASDDRTLKLWDLAAGTVLQTFEGHADAVQAVTVLPDGQRALSASDDGKLKLWDLAAGTALLDWDAPSGLPNVGTMLLGTMLLMLWDVAEDALLQCFENNIGSETAVSVSSDGRRALSGGWDGKLRLWDLTAGTVLRTFEAHSGAVTAVSVLPDGKRALSGSGDRRLKLWDLTADGGLDTSERHRSWVYAVMLLPDGKRALSCSGDRTLKLWDLNTGAVLRTFEGHTDEVRAVVVLSDGQRALSGSGDKTLKLWDLTTGAVLRTFEGHSDSVLAVTVLPDGKRALSGSADGTLKLWDLAAGTLLKTFEEDRDGSRRPMAGDTGWVNVVTVLSDGQRALSGSSYGTLNLWDLTAGTILHTFEDQHSGVTAMAVLPDSQRVISGSQNGTLNLWDLTTGNLLRTLKGHTSEVGAVTVLPGGHRAVSGGFDRTLKLWDLTSADALCTFYDDGLVLALSAVTDDLRVATGNELGRVYMLKIEVNE